MSQDQPDGAAEPSAITRSATAAEAALERLKAGSRSLVHVLADTLGPGTWKVSVALGDAVRGYNNHTPFRLVLRRDGQGQIIPLSMTDDPMVTLPAALLKGGILTVLSEDGWGLVWLIESGQLVPLRSQAAAAMGQIMVVGAKRYADAPELEWSIAFS